MRIETGRPGRPAAPSSRCTGTFNAITTHAQASSAAVQRRLTRSIHDAMGCSSPIGKLHEVWEVAHELAAGCLVRLTQHRLRSALRNTHIHDHCAPALSVQISTAGRNPCVLSVAKKTSKVYNASGSENTPWKLSFAIVERSSSQHSRRAEGGLRGACPSRSDETPTLEA